MLPTKLYLDTARLGQTSPSALQAQIDFARLTAEDPSSLYFEKFIRDGVDACPEIADRFPGLAHWHGIADLKRRLASMAGDPDRLRVLLANRSAELMRLAAHCQFQVCRNVLVTDLSWPNWLAILKEEATRAGGRVTMAHISRAIMQDRCSSDDVCHHLSQVYATHECDGLFLPIVSNLGVHLPVAKIVAALRTVGSVNYTIADGAQALNHVDLTEPMKVSDFIVAGAHKWLCAGQPLGIGICSSIVGTDVEAVSVQAVSVDDSLFAGSRRMTADGENGSMETVNLSPFFACSGALTDAEAPVLNVASESRIRNTFRLAKLFVGSDWIRMATTNELQAGILLIRPADPSVFARNVRPHFMEHGIAVSTYADGTVRVSAPVEDVNTSQELLVRGALRNMPRGSSIHDCRLNRRECGPWPSSRQSRDRS